MKLDATAVQGWANYDRNKKFAIQDLMKYYGFDHHAKCAVLSDVAGEPELTFCRTEPPGRDSLVIKVDVVKARANLSCPYTITQTAGSFTGQQDRLQVAQINAIFQSLKGQ